MKNIAWLLVVAAAAVILNPSRGLAESWPSLEDYVHDCVLIVRCKTEDAGKLQYRVLETWKGKFSPDLFVFSDTPPEGCLYAHQNHGNERPRKGREVIFFFTKRNQPDSAKGKLEHHSTCLNIEDGKVLYAKNSDFEEKEYTVEEFQTAVTAIVEDQEKKPKAEAGKAEPPNVRVSLAVSEGYGQAKKPLHVVIQNTGDKPQQHFEEWNSWGYGNLTLHWSDERGKTGTMTKIAKGWDKNHPSTVTLQPGEALVREITFDPELWEGGPAIRPGMKLRLTVHYQSKPEKDVPVWVGKSSSPARRCGLELMEHAIRAA